MRCQRTDGTFYGTAGRCQRGREVGPRQIDRAIKRITQSFSATKNLVFQDLINRTEGMSGVHKDLGNGIYVIRGDAGKLEGFGRLPGVPRPIATVRGKYGHDVVIARKTHRPWNDMRLPKGTISPIREDKPHKFWMNIPWNKNPDIDMAVNPVMLTARSLLQPAYEAYNREFFDNNLPPVGLFISPSMQRAAGMAFGFEDPKIPDFIALSWRHLKGATEEAIHGILLHEMVHIHEYQNNLWDEDHGPFFKSKLNQIHREWRRESPDIYPDELLWQPDARTSGQAKRAYSGRQFPHIRNVSELRAKAQDYAYIFRKWK